MSPINKMRLFEFECPNCSDRYRIHEIEINEGLVPCWKCGAEYLQKLHKTSVPQFIRRAIFNVKGQNK